MDRCGYGKLGSANPGMIEVSTDGPYVVTGVATLVNSRGERLPAQPKMTLCRCGGSANKPFCDGTHTRISFDGRKLDDRVPDRRDNYAAGRLTIHDNRGICAHAGFCSAALPAVFRTHDEPFIDPTAADIDAIVAQVKHCPSGALSYSIDREEYRDLARAPTITISADGPYYVTGGIQLIGGDPGAEGASTEHYALCRCGGSKNKPFCDGTHWYNSFHDDKN